MPVPLNEEAHGQRKELFLWIFGGSFPLTPAYLNQLATPTICPLTFNCLWIQLLKLTVAV